MAQAHNSNECPKPHYCAGLCKPHYDRQWRLKHIEAERERGRAYQTGWRKNNPEEAKKRLSEWRDKNRDKIKAYRKAYYAKTQDKYLPLNNKWNKDNFERSRPVRQKYVREHLAEIRLHSAKRRAKTKGAIIKLEDIENWATRICGICSIIIKESEKYDIDHKTPLARGGLHVASNLQIAHRRCNRHKGAKLQSELGVLTD